MTVASNICRIQVLQGIAGHGRTSQGLAGPRRASQGQIRIAGPNQNCRACVSASTVKPSMHPFKKHPISGLRIRQGSPHLEIRLQINEGYIGLAPIRSNISPSDYLTGLQAFQMSRTANWSICQSLAGSCFPRPLEPCAHIPFSLCNGRGSLQAVWKRRGETSIPTNLTSLAPAVTCLYQTTTVSCALWAVELALIKFHIGLRTALLWLTAHLRHMREVRWFGLLSVRGPPTNMPGLWAPNLPNCKDCKDWKD